MLKNSLNALKQSLNFENRLKGSGFMVEINIPKPGHIWTKMLEWGQTGQIGEF